MRRPSLTLGALVGGLTSLPVIALLYLGEQFARLPYLPFDFFDWLARVLPGDVITLAIDAIVRTIQALRLGSTSTSAKLIEQLMANGIMVGAGVLLGLGIALALRRLRLDGWQVGAVGGFLLFLFFIAVEISHGMTGDPVLSGAWLLALLGGWGVLLGGWLGGEDAPVAEGATTRRAALVRLAGGSVGVALGAWGLGRVLEGQSVASGAGQPLSERAAASPAQQAAPALPAPPAAPEGRLVPAPGTRPELTPNESFYRIDINTRPLVIQEAEWQLEVDGLFDRPRPLSLKELMAYPALTQPLTMSCISNRVGGDLIGTSNWTGARLSDVLADLGMQDGAQALYVEGGDGFFETIVLEDLLDPRAMLVYAMNGETLPVEHGFPLRVYIPNRYGMKQPKWITRISAVGGWEPGYWVVRGWSQEARPQIVSVIDTVEQGEAGQPVPVGGIAWAGDRGIQKVEVQVDGGEWVEADLRTPTLSPLTWVQWRYDWAATPGRHTLRVRATDGTGALQVEAVQGVRPDGATGYHERRVTL